MSHVTNSNFAIKLKSVISGGAAKSVISPCAANSVIGPALRTPHQPVRRELRISPCAANSVIGPRCEVLVSPALRTPLSARAPRTPYQPCAANSVIGPRCEVLVSAATPPRCEARLCLAGQCPPKTGLRPSFGLCPPGWAKGRTRGIAPFIVKASGEAEPRLTSWRQSR
jgi:hypothetical protein